jgi:prepilin-type processing-associated H-X9-DG protein
MRASNAIAHKYDGQNVLFLDGHVYFERNSFCGVNEDNIYTSWDGLDIRRGVPPKLGSQPADRLDSLLVSDPAIPRGD